MKKHLRLLLVKFYRVIANVCTIQVQVCMCKYITGGNNNNGSESGSLTQSILPLSNWVRVNMYKSHALILKCFHSHSLNHKSVFCACSKKRGQSGKPTNQATYKRTFFTFPTGKLLLLHCVYLKSNGSWYRIVMVLMWYVVKEEVKVYGIKRKSPQLYGQTENG